MRGFSARVHTKTGFIIGGLGVVAFLCGCQPNNKAEAIRASGSAKPTVADLKFESSEDPPIKARTHFAAGQLAEDQKDFNRAVEQYWAAVKIDPKYKAALYRLGVVYCMLQHYPDAVVAWKLYIKATDGDATGYSNLGFCHELAGHYADAEEAYRHGIEKEPQSNPCRVNYGLMLARANRITEAMIQLQAVLTPAEVHYNLASVFEQQGLKERARVEYRKALTLDPGMADAEVRLSVLK
jgi:tetratricopeptide (TPR) repeat protein